MKKLITVTLILALLLPCVSFAGESDVVGCWGRYEKLETGTPVMTMLYLAEDHTCYFLTQMFLPSSDGVGRTYIGTWEMSADGSVYVKTGDNSDMTLSFSDTYVGAVDLNTGDMFVNLSKFF